MHRFAMVFLAIGIFLTGRADSIGEDSPSDEIYKVLRWQHGLARLSPEQRIVLASIVAHPDKYLPILAEKLRSLDALQIVSDQESRRQDELLIVLIAEIGTDAVYSILRDAYSRLEQRCNGLKGDSTATALRGHMISLKRVILDCMGQKGSKALVNFCLRSVEHEDYANQLVILRYFERVGSNDQRVIDSLKIISQNKQSSLFENNRLMKTIDALSKPK